jgi:hypothetical protein
MPRATMRVAASRPASLGSGSAPLREGGGGGGGDEPPEPTGAVAAAAVAVAVAAPTVKDPAVFFQINLSKLRANWVAGEARGMEVGT